MVTVEQLRPEHVRPCVAVMRRLPDGFGIEQAIVSYAEDLASCDGFVAIVDGALGGSLA